MRALGLVLALAPLTCAAPPPPLGNRSPEPLSFVETTLAALRPPDAKVYGPEPLPPACPDGMVHIGRYCVDRYEEHLVIRGEGGKRAPHPHYQRPPENAVYEAESAPGFFPQGYISRKESALACKNAGKRLCTWHEWRRACQGPNWTVHPYGNHGRRGACNQLKNHLLNIFFGSDVNKWEYEEHFNSPRLNQEPGYLAKSGDYSECVTAEGLYDMVGNLHEWVSTMVDDEFVENMKNEEVERQKQPWHYGNGMFMGGFYSTDAQHGPGCYYTTIAHEPRYHDYSTGFRCCADALYPKVAKKKKKPMARAAG